MQLIGTSIKLAVERALLGGDTAPSAVTRTVSAAVLNVAPRRAVTVSEGGPTARPAVPPQLRLISF